MKKNEFIEKLIKLAIPIALQSLLLASVSAADAFMLGRLDQNSMAAVSLASQIQFIMTMFIGAVTSAGSILGSQYWGKRDMETVDDIFNLMLKFMVVIDILFFILCTFTPMPLMSILTNIDELKRIGCEYLVIAGFSYLLVGFSQVYHTIMKISGHATMSMSVSVVAVLLNIVFNYLLIFGIGPFPKLGAEGAAISTVLSRIVEILWCVIISYKRDYIHPHFKHFFKRNGLLVKDFSKISLPILGASLIWGVGFTSYTAIVAHINADAAAANSIAAVVRDLICCLCNGIATAGGIILGNELGAGHKDTAKDYGIRLRNMSFVIGFISTGIMLALTPLIVNFMILTDTAKSYLTGMMIIQAFYMIGRCVNTVTINGVFDCGGDTMFDVYSLVVMMWLVAVPTALLGAFVFHWPVLAVYACTCLDEVGKIPWVMVHFKKYKWLRDLTR